MSYTEGWQNFKQIPCLTCFFFSFQLQKSHVKISESPNALQELVIISHVTFSIWNFLFHSFQDFFFGPQLLGNWTLTKLLNPTKKDDKLWNALFSRDHLVTLISGGIKRIRVSRCFCPTAYICYLFFSFGLNTFTNRWQKKGLVTRNNDATLGERTCVWCKKGQRLSLLPLCNLRFHPKKWNYFPD